MADVFYLAVSAAAAAVLTALVVGRGSQLASDHRAGIARVWHRLTAVVGVWALYLLTEMAAPLLPVLGFRLRWRPAVRLLLAAASCWLAARLHAAPSGSPSYRRAPGGIYR